MSKQVTDAETRLQCHQVAALIGQGLKRTEIRAQLGLTVYELNKIVEHPDTQNLIKDAAEETGKVALNALKKGIARMADLTLKALEANLRKNSMQAVNTALQVLGVLDRDKAPVGEQSITVVLPGGEQPTTIEVKADGSSIDSQESH